VPPEPVYVPKTTPGDLSPWVSFGSARGEYERWVPEICGICCLKMIGDTEGNTGQLSLYQMTMMAVANGTFIADQAEGIKGAYHRPLAELARQLGIACDAARDVNTLRIRRELGSGRYVILSVDLAKVGRGLRGGHLVLIYDHDDAADEVLLHDCSSVLREDGRAVSMTWSELESISNRKGLVVG
jgi:hypothetical protein